MCKCLNFKPLTLAKISVQTNSFSLPKMWSHAFSSCVDSIDTFCLHRLISQIVKGLLMYVNAVFLPALFLPVWNFHMLSIDLYVNRAQPLPSFGQGNKVYPSHSQCMQNKQPLRVQSKTHTITSTPYCLTRLAHLAHACVTSLDPTGGLM